MEDLLTQRVRRVHHALGQTKSTDVKRVRGEHAAKGDKYVFRVDFNQGRTQEDLANVVSSLISSIASIKDHLKHWCVENGREFRGDALIDSNRDVALVHDLWNLDKHGRLTHPRSGCTPRLTGLVQALETRGITPDVPSDSSVSFTYSLETGEMVQMTSDGGVAELVVNATVEDENGNDIGQLQDICRRAIDVWESELIEVGLGAQTP
jgi:hypothetical protein